VIRKICGPKKDEIGHNLRALHNEELHDSCQQPSIIRIVKSRKILWADHVARNAYRSFVGNTLEQREENESIILKWKLSK
jgi:hypothetical protein